MKQEEFLRTIEAVHAAGLDESLWPAALSKVTQLVGGVGTTFEAFDKQTMRMTDFWSHGIPPGSEIKYAEHFVSISPRIVLGYDYRMGNVGYDRLVIDEAAIDRDPYYSDFLRGAGLRYFVSGTLTRTPQEFSCIAVQRSARQGHIDAREIALMRRILPHVRQAFDVTRRLREAGAAVRAFEHALDWLSDGVALLAADGKVLHANSSLQRTLRSNDGLTIKKGQIEFAAPETRQRFAQVFATTIRAGPSDSAGQGDFPAPRRSNGPAFLVSLRPLARQSRGVRHDERAAAILFVRDPLQREASPTRLLRELFDLTAAEADLAGALQTGIAIEAYGRSRHLSRNTVYTHLRHIKEKTGARNMTELFRKLNDTNSSLRGG